MSYRAITNQITNRSAEIFIYGYVGEDVVAADILMAIRMLETTNDKIVFRVNSGGGNIFEGLAIFNAIKNCKCETEAMIDGLAASMGSVIPMACTSVKMSKHAMFMTHKASGWMVGNANEMRNYAQLMESLETAICNIYAAKTGLTCEDARSKYLSNEDRWITAQEALSEKIIDGIYDSEIAAPAATIKDEKKLVAFYNKTLIKNQKLIEMFKIELTAQQATAMGLSGNENDVAKVAAIDALVAKAKRTEALDLELIEEKAKVTALENKIAEAAAAANTAKITGLVDAAVNAKKIVATDKDRYIKLATADFDTTKEIIDAMQPYMSVAERLATGAQAKPGSRLEILSAMTGRDLYMAGNFEELKKLSMEVYKEKHLEYFKKEYKG